MFSWADTSTFYAKLQTGVYFYKPKDKKPLKTRVYNETLTGLNYHSTHGPAEVRRCEGHEAYAQREQGRLQRLHRQMPFSWGVVKSPCKAQPKPMAVSPAWGPVPALWMLVLRRRHWEAVVHTRLETALWAWIWSGRSTWTSWSLGLIHGSAAKALHAFACKVTTRVSGYYCKAGRSDQSRLYYNTTLKKA